MVSDDDPASKPDGPYCERCGQQRPAGSSRWCGETCRRRANLESAYGLDPTKQEFQKLWDDCLGICPICKRHSRRVEMVIEHCHKTGRVRGICCSSCNQALAGFYDNVELLRRAVDFMENPPCDRVLGPRVVTEKHAGGKPARRSRKRRS
jgi:hypothetical protein